MLIATPYRDFEVRGKSPPKIISEIRKSYVRNPSPCLRPKLSGDLLVKCGTERSWWPRKVQIRGGQLHVQGVRGEEGPSPIRLPLRHLSLQAGPLPNSLSLCRGQNSVLAIQTASESVFDDWVKTIAIELIRQTPLDSIKYLDILTLAECWERREKNFEKDWNFNNVTNISPCENCTSNDECLDNSPPQIFPTKNEAIVTEEKQVEDLLKKCQNVENYVPVKEKLFLFESLSKLGRKVRSTEDVSLRVDSSASKRTKSLHDLSSINSHIAVREICKYFENKTETDNNEVHCKTPNANSNLENVYTFRKVLVT